MLEVRDLTKHYGSTVAVDHLSFSVADGCVTGFVGPNGAGKSTTMRMMLQLDRSESGECTFDGRQFRELRHPLREVGSLLDAAYVHPTRSARNHLLAMAISNGIGRARVDEVLGTVGLSEVSTKRVGGFSLGMRQRLGLAGALLGDPHTMLLDEPANGLDPEGILWIRNFMKSLAAEGRTVLVSSHVLPEIALTADKLVVIGKGRLIDEGTVQSFVQRSTGAWVEIASPRLSDLVSLLEQHGAQVTAGPRAEIATVRGLTAAQIGELAATNAIVLHELSPREASLEEAFLEVTKGSGEFATAEPAPGAGPGATPGATPGAAPGATPGAAPGDPS